MQKTRTLQRDQNNKDCGGGATRPIPWDGCVEKLLKGPTDRPHPKVWTRDQKWK